MRHTFKAEQWLPFPVEQVFSFFANPENLPKLMPRWQQARIEEASFAPPPPRPKPAASGAASKTLAAGAGTRMTISFRPFPLSPIRVPWLAEITEFEWNDHFCDIQTKGPFAYWHHCHYISPEARDGHEGSLLRDIVEYELPFGFLGEIISKLAAERQFNSIFRTRQERTAELLALTLPSH